MSEVVRVRMREGDRGQAAVVLMVVVAVMAASLSLALVALGGAMIDRGRAQAAADAAALASLEGGRVAAAQLAAANGGVVESWSRGPGAYEVTVVVRVGRALATARATDEP